MRLRRMSALQRREAQDSSMAAVDTSITTYNIQGCISEQANQTDAESGKFQSRLENKDTYILFVKIPKQSKTQGQGV